MDKIEIGTARRSAGLHSNENDTAKESISAIRKVRVVKLDPHSKSNSRNEVG
jgi:hypothetical protein